MKFFQNIGQESKSLIGIEERTMISLKAQFFNGGEIQDLLKTRQSQTQTTSLFSLPWTDTTSTVDTQINSKVVLGVEVCTHGVKSTTSTSISTISPMFTAVRFACGAK